MYKNFLSKLSLKTAKSNGIHKKALNVYQWRNVIEDVMDQEDITREEAIEFVKNKYKTEVPEDLKIDMMGETQVLDSSKSEKFINLIDACRPIAYKFQFYNKNGQPFNVVSFSETGNEFVRISIRYVEGLDADLLKTSVGEITESNADVNPCLVANLKIKDNIVSDTNLFSEGGFQSIDVDTQPMNSLPKQYNNSDAFEFFNKVLEKACIELDKYIQRMKYVLLYNPPFNPSDEVYLSSERLRSTEFGSEIKDNALDQIIQNCYNNYEYKLRTSLNLPNVGDITFKIDLIRKTFNRLLDIYIRGSVFKKVLKRITYYLYYLMKSHDYQLHMSSVIDKINSDSSLDVYINGVVSCFQKDGQINYDYNNKQPEVLTSEYIQRYFELFEQYEDSYRYEYKGELVLKYDVIKNAKGNISTIEPVQYLGITAMAGYVYTVRIELPVLPDNDGRFDNFSDEIIVGGITWKNGDYLLITKDISPDENPKGKIQKLDHNVGVGLTTSANNKYLHFIKIVADYDEYNKDLENLNRDIRDLEFKKKLNPEDYQEYEETDIDNIKDPQEAQIEEADKQVEEESLAEVPKDNSTDTTQDESKYAALLREDHEFSLEGFSSNSYSEYAYQRLDDFLAEREGLELVETNGSCALYEDGQLVEGDRINTIMKDFSKFLGLIDSNDEVVESADVSSFLKGKKVETPDYNKFDLVTVSNNFILNKAATQNIYNIFITTASTDKINLERLQKEIRALKETYDGYNNKQFASQVITDIFATPLDQDLRKSLLYACTSIGIKDITKWTDFILGLITFDILILNVVLTEHDHKVAQRRLSAIFRSMTTYKKYFLISELQATDTTLQERLQFVDKNASTVITVNQFLNYLLKHTKDYSYTIQDDRVVFQKLVKRKIKVKEKDIDPATGKPKVDPKTGKILYKDVDQEKYEVDENHKVTESEIQPFLDAFNKEKSKNLTYGTLINAKINYSELSPSRPLSPMEFKETTPYTLSQEQKQYLEQLLKRPVDSTGVITDTFLISLNNEGLNKLTEKLDIIEKEINNLDFNTGGVDVNK